MNALWAHRTSSPAPHSTRSAARKGGLPVAFVAKQPAHRPVVTVSSQVVGDSGLDALLYGPTLGHIFGASSKWAPGPLFLSPETSPIL